MSSLPADARSAWRADRPVENEWRAAKHRLTDGVRRLIEMVALLDAGEVDVSELDGVAAEVDAVAARLAALPSMSGRGGLAGAGGPEGSLTERSGISGFSNPLAAPLVLEVGTPLTKGTAVFGPAYEGPLGHVHGGFVAAAFDELLGVTQSTSGIAGYTGTLTIRMRRPTPLRKRIDYEAGVEGIDGRKIRVWGRSYCDGELLGEADGLFIAPADGSRPR